MTKPEYVQVQLTPQEKDLLRQIADREGRIGFSGVIRRFINDEAQRRGIYVASPSDGQAPGNKPVK